MSAQDIDATNQVISANVKRIREARGISVREFARRMTDAGQPFAAGDWSKMMAGRRRWNSNMIHAAGAALGVEPAGLLTLPHTKAAAVAVLGWASGALTQD